jgi:type IV secretory pathway component VirB8
MKTENIEKICEENLSFVKENYSMEAFYTIDFVQVTKESIHLNPLGIQIKDFSVSQER